MNKMTLLTIDDEIRDVENRLAAERLALNDAVNDCSNSLKETLTSPKTLFALGGMGYALGKVMFRPKAAPQTAAPVKKAGVLGLLTGVAGTALSISGGKWGTVAKWAAGRYFSRKKAARSAAAVSAFPRASTLPSGTSVTRSAPVMTYPSATTPPSPPQ